MRRRAILKAAEKVFAEKGYMQATLDEVAQRAEFGKGTLYNYFEGGKEDILLSLFDEIYDAFCDLIDASFAAEHMHNRPLRVVFHDFVLACLIFFEEHRDRFMLLITEGHRMAFSDDHTRAAYFQHQMERMAGKMVPYLEAAMASGHMRRFPPKSVAHLVLGNIKGYQMHTYLTAYSGAGQQSTFGSAKEAAGFLTSLLLDGLIVEHAP